jgi:hypothetical protein
VIYGPVFSAYFARTMFPVMGGSQRGGHGMGEMKLRIGGIRMGVIDSHGHELPLLVVSCNSSSSGNPEYSQVKRWNEISWIVISVLQ